MLEQSETAAPPWEAESEPASSDGSDLTEPLGEPEMEETPEGMPSFLRDEIAPLLAAAERAAAQIVERAREQARDELAQLERTRLEVEARVAEVVAWQQNVEPSLRSLQAKVSDIQQKIEEVPDLIRKALDPVATAISSLDPTLAEVAASARPLLSLEPLPIDLPHRREEPEL